MFYEKLGSHVLQNVGNTDTTINIEFGVHPRDELPVLDTLITLQRHTGQKAVKGSTPEGKKAKSYGNRKTLKDNYEKGDWVEDGRGDKWMDKFMLRNTDSTMEPSTRMHLLGFLLGRRLADIDQSPEVVPGKLDRKQVPGETITGEVPAELHLELEKPLHEHTTNQLDQPTYNQDRVIEGDLEYGEDDLDSYDLQSAEGEMSMGNSKLDLDAFGVYHEHKDRNSHHKKPQNSKMRKSNGWKSHFSAVRRRHKRSLGHETNRGSLTHWMQYINHSFQTPLDGVHGEGHSHAHSHGPGHSHTHSHDHGPGGVHGHGSDHGHSHGLDHANSHSHVHSHGPAHSHTHSHDHGAGAVHRHGSDHGYSHNFGQGKSLGYVHSQYYDHGSRHRHAPGQSHSHNHHHGPGQRHGSFRENAVDGFYDFQVPKPYRLRTFSGWKPNRSAARHRKKRSLGSWGSGMYFHRRPAGVDSGHVRWGHNRVWPEGPKNHGIVQQGEIERVYEPLPRYNTLNKGVNSIVYPTNPTPYKTVIHTTWIPGHPEGKSSTDNSLHYRVQKPWNQGNSHGHSHGSGHSHNPGHSHSHSHGSGHGPSHSHSPDHSHAQSHGPGHSHTHSHDHRPGGVHGHGSDHGRSHGLDHGNGLSHSHAHSHGPGHSHDPGHSPGHSHANSHNHANSPSPGRSDGPVHSHGPDHRDGPGHDHGPGGVHGHGSDHGHSHRLDHGHSHAIGGQGKSLGPRHSHHNKHHGNYIHGNYNQLHSSHQGHMHGYGYRPGHIHNDMNDPGHMAFHPSHTAGPYPVPRLIQGKELEPPPSAPAPWIRPVAPLPPHRTSLTHYPGYWNQLNYVYRHNNGHKVAPHPLRHVPNPQHGNWVKTSRFWSPWNVQNLVKSPIQRPFGDDLL